MWIILYSWIKVFVDIMSFSYWGFKSYLEVRSERYGFSNADHQTVTWVNTEIVTFGNIFRSFYIIMGIVRKLQSVVSSTSLIMYTSLLEFEIELSKAWKWNLGSEQSNDSKSVSIEPSWHYLSFYEPHNTSPDIKHSIIHFKNIKNPYSIYIN